MKNIETRKTEVRFSTSDSAEMLGKFLAKDLLRCWQVDFLDEDTGQVIIVDRNELIAQTGQLIEGDLLSRINFHLQAGDISKVEVSNQRREAFCLKNTHMYPYAVSFEVTDKKKKYLLYAPSVEAATEIMKDYIELNFIGGYQIKMVKEFSNCIMLHDSLCKLIHNTNGAELAEEEVSEYEKKFYQIEVNVLHDEATIYEKFVLFTKDVDTAMVQINNYISNEIKRRAKSPDFNQPLEFKTTIESAVVIPFNGMVEREFSEAYTES